MKNKVQKMSFTAISIALAVVIAELMKLIPILKMPSGGSASLALLPIYILGFALGPVYGLIGGLSYGVINFFIDGYGYNPWSILFDYALAFGLAGVVAGLASKWAMKGFKWYNYVAFGAGMILSSFVRFWMHVIAGKLAWETPFVANIAYNAPYVFASCALCLAVGYAIYVPLTRLVISRFKERKENESEEDTFEK